MRAFVPRGSVTTSATTGTRARNASSSRAEACQRRIMSTSAPRLESCSAAPSAEVRQGPSLRLISVLTKVTMPARVFVLRKSAFFDQVIVTIESVNQQLACRTNL